ncbi:bile acid:sodium symporter family protein [Salinifilum ghardaiensis]
MRQLVSLRGWRPDGFVVALLATVLAAAVLPARGSAAAIAAWFADLAVPLLFFLYGARLSRRAVLAGARHWRLHVVILASTFALFPVLGLVSAPVVSHLLPGQLAVGFLFLCTLPSTVQSSVALTSTARGNVPAAICSASMSTVLGVVTTPVLVAVLLSTGSSFSAASIASLLTQLIVPFAAGQLARRWIGERVENNRRALSHYERGSILLIVYVAFSSSVTAGTWSEVGAAQVASLALLGAVLLASVMALLHGGTRLLRLPRTDRSTIVLCGSLKSLATGLPIAGALFPGPQVGAVIVPVMLYHLLQLIVSAVYARGQARRAAAPEEAAPDLTSSAVPRDREG